MIGYVCRHFGHLQLCKCISVRDRVSRLLTVFKWIEPLFEMFRERRKVPSQQLKLLFRKIISSTDVWLLNRRVKT